MKKNILAIASLSTLCMASFVNANEGTASSTGVTLKAGVAGYGFDITQAINPHLNIRAGYSHYGVTKTTNKDDIDYKGTVDLGGWDLLADYHPWAGGFRLTAGIYGPKHSIKGRAESTNGTYTINDKVYTSDAVNNLDLSAKWSGTHPYFGLGYDGFNKSSAGGFFFSTDLGVIMSGKPSVDLTANCNNQAACSAFEKDLAAEKASIENDLQDAKYLPILQLGIGYRF